MDANTVPDCIYVLFLMFFNGLNQNPDFGSEAGEGEQSSPSGHRGALMRNSGAQTRLIWQCSFSGHGVPCFSMLQ
ncbi:MAG: hypothetical protein ACK5XJ_00025, partial [Burkholderiales bacterium]